MRNAVIRKKVLREQAILRKYLFAPQRFIVPAGFEWSDVSEAQKTRLWASQ